jgi:RNase P/RNase MRP subunit p30
LDVTDWKDAAGITSLAHEMGADHGPFTIRTRKTLFFEDRARIKRDLAGIRERSKVDLLCLRSTNAEVLNFSAKDSRIDMIRIEPGDLAEKLADGTASLAGQTGVGIEISFAPILDSHGTGRSRVLRQYAKIIDTCSRNHAAIVISCDARRPVELRGAWQKQVTLSSLLELSRQVTKAIVRDNPRAVLARRAAKVETTQLEEVGTDEEGEDA